MPLFCFECDANVASIGVAAISVSVHSSVAGICPRVLNLSIRDVFCCYSAAHILWWTGVAGTSGATREWDMK